MSNATVEIETITPQKAKEWLENRFEGQRKVRKNFVQRLAAEISNGTWKVSSDAICLINGKLGNGQHRCEAIIEADTPVQALVMRTDDDELFNVMDSGITRKVSDVLGQYSFIYTTNVAAAAKVILLYKRGRLTPFGQNNSSKKDGEVTNILTRAEVIDFCQENKDRLIQYAQSVEGYQEKRLLTISLAVAFMYIACEVNKTKAEQFIKSLYEGGTNDAAFVMRERLISNKLSHEKIIPSYVFGLLIKAFRAYLKGETPGRLLIKGSEEFPRL